jgi:hypothetical protein
MQMSKGKAAAVAVTGAVALALAAGTGATAATLITSKQIKDNTIQSRDIRDGTIQSRDVRDGTLGSADVGDGAVGLKKVGSDVRGSLAGGRIPSATTVTGVAHWRFTSTVFSENEFAVNLPGRAGKNLTGSDVNFAADSASETVDDDPACTGTYELPTAPPGKVCLYSKSRTSDTSGLQGNGYGRSDAFSVRWVDTGGAAATTVYVEASWAYTAP